MLRLTDYLKVGGRLVAGDKCYNTKNEEDNEFDGIVAEGRPFAGQYEFIGKGFGIYDSEDIKSLVITSFSPRKNNGTQPVPDDFPVVITWRDSYFSEKTTASEVRWEFDFEWKPDIDKLLEQQNEYDKQQEKPIEEIMINAKKSKMSEFKEHQVVYTQKVSGLITSEWLYGCTTPDGRSCVLFSDTVHVIMDLSEVSATPFKDELEIAQEEQIEMLVGKWSHWFYSTEKAADFFKVLQGSGDLSEIILPLESK